MNLLNFIPELVLLTVGVVLAVVTVTSLSWKECASFTKPFMTLAAAVLLGGTLFTLYNHATIFHSTYRVDLFSQGFKFLLALAYLVTVLFAEKWTGVSENRRTEFYLLLSAATLGMMMLVSSVHILIFYVSLELSSYSLYIMSALKNEKKGAEAAVKYIIFGAAASGIFLWGLSLIAGLAGTGSLLKIAALAPGLAGQPAFAAGLFFVILSFLFKLSGFPMHAWAPDVYESAPLPVTGFIATASKAAAAAILIRFLTLAELTVSFTALLGAAAFASMTIGNCVALVQKDVKRLLAYSSIAQAGYLLVGLLAGTMEGYSSALFYAFGYVMMNAGAFLVTLWIAQASKNDNPQIQDFDGLADRSPFLALILLLSLLSLAGIPPLVGFTGKWILFSAAMDKGHWFLVLWGVLNSVVSLFYYLTLVKHAYLEKPKDPTPIPLPTRLQILGLFLFAALVFLGVFPNNLITFTREAVSSILL